MPLINTSAPNLIQGVSQQADPTRFDGQCEEQVNALSSVASGLMKRPNTRHIAKLLTTAIDNNSFVHFINRSGTEKYVLIHDGTHLTAYSLIDGFEKYIEVNNVKYRSNYNAGKYPIGNTYLNTNTPRSSLKALTVADSTFILNKEQPVALGATKSPVLPKEALLFIKQGDYKKKYGFKVEVVASANSGTPATLTFKSWRTDCHYINRRAYIQGITVPQAGSGTGFAKDDIVNIPLPSSKTVETEDEEGDDFTYNVNLQLFTQPTMRITSVGANGKILGASVEDRGSFIYRETGNSFNGFGLGSDFDEDNPCDFVGSESISIPTTNNTAISSGGTSNTVILKKKFMSHGGSTATNAQYIATSYLLKQVADIDNSPTSGQHLGTSDGLENYFETAGDVDQNVLILKVKKTNNIDAVDDFNITPIDDLNGFGMGVVYKEVNSISDLPVVAKNGFEVKVVGDADISQDDYYVRFETTSGEDIGKGSWIECVAPDTRLGYNSSTLPIEILSEADGFKFRTMKLADRVSGNDISNPLASFVGQQIDNLFFFKNRLGFLSKENVVMSESGLGILDSTGQLNYNFGRTTVTTLLDSDPIDVSVASSRVTNLRSAKAFQENLVLFSENGQFVMKGGDVLTPKTVSIIPITNFNFEDLVDPLPLGSYIYFPFTRGQFTGLREFTVNASTDTYDSTEVTEHVPAYIPKNIIAIAGTTSEDMLVLLSNDERNALYLYTYFWSNNQKVLSAWSKFTFKGEIRGMEFIDSTLHMIIAENSETHLVELPLESGVKDATGRGNRDGSITHLDMRVHSHPIASKFEFTGATGSCAQFNNIDYQWAFIFNRRKGYNSVSASDNSQWLYSGGRWYLYDSSSGTTVNYAISAQDFAMCPWEANWTGTHLANATFTQIGSINKIYLPYTPDNNTVEVYKFDGTRLPSQNTGNVVTLDSAVPQSTNVWVGIPYTMKYTFSERLFKAKAGSGLSASNAAKLLIRNGSIYYDKTRRFDVLVTPKGRSTRTSSFNNGTTSEDGFFRFPVLASSEDAIITIQNNTIHPSNFSSAEFESFVHSRSSRYG